MEEGDEVGAVDAGVDGVVVDPLEDEEEADEPESLQRYQATALIALASGCP